MTSCERGRSGDIELYFYGDVDASERVGIEAHLLVCTECRQAVDDLELIASALSSRPLIEAPPRGDWANFTRRLEDAVRLERSAAVVRSLDGPDFDRQAQVVWRPQETLRDGRKVSIASYLALAALLTLVTSSLVYVAQSTRARPASQANAATSVATPDPSQRQEPAMPVVDSIISQNGSAERDAFAALSEQHFERSKLVVFGLANKDVRKGGGEDWAYERGLASDLLNDTRLYRLAAEQRGMKQIAGVMGDLELVLLQTSLADVPDRAALAQIQRLIRKRNLVTKIENGSGFWVQTSGF
jgi:hypothetical protein